MISSIALAFPTAFWICLSIVLVAIFSLVLYALRNKDDVRAEISHGSTTFKLEAKGNASRKRLG